LVNPESLILQTVVGQKVSPIILDTAFKQDMDLKLAFYVIQRTNVDT